MKKLLSLSIALLAALMVQAQGFVFQFHGEALPDGATVVIEAEEDVWGDMSCETNSTANPTDGLVLCMLNGATLPGTAFLEITSNGLNPYQLKWCMGGECVSLGDRTSLTKQFTASPMTLVQFDAESVQSEGLLTATLRASVGLETHTVNIHFVHGDYDAIALPQASADGGTAICCDLSGRRLPEGSRPGGVYIVRDSRGIRKVMTR